MVGVEVHGGDARLPRARTAATSASFDGASPSFDVTTSIGTLPGPRRGAEPPRRAGALTSSAICCGDVPASDSMSVAIIATTLSRGLPDAAAMSAAEMSTAPRRPCWCAAVCTVTHPPMLWPPITRRRRVDAK